MGVDVFFVISGFLMAELYDRTSALQFYKRRIQRLLLAYAATVGAALAIGALMLIPPDFYQLVSLAKMARMEGMGLAVISPVPTYEKSIPMEMFLSNGNVNGYATDKDKHNRRIQSFLALEKELLEHGVRIYDPADIYCPDNGSCAFASMESKPYYFDDAHLTLTGAAKLKPMFDKIFKELKI